MCPLLWLLPQLLQDLSRLHSTAFSLAALAAPRENCCDVEPRTLKDTVSSRGTHVGFRQDPPAAEEGELVG